MNKIAKMYLSIHLLKKEDMQIMVEHMMVLKGNLNIIKISNLLRLHSKFNTIPTKIPVELFGNVEMILKFLGKNKQVK